jgi:hypothetical protein
MGGTTISAAWPQTGFKYQNKNLATYLNINEQEIQESRDFREIWNFDYHELQRSARQQNQRWGRINEPLFRKKQRTTLKA